jgi:hypothetical protein
MIQQHQFARGNIGMAWLPLTPLSLAAKKPLLLIDNLLKDAY